MPQPVTIKRKEKHEGWTPLHWAAAKGNAEAIRRLMAAGADVNAKTNGGWTPLHRAADLGQLAAIKVLLAAGADVNAKANNGWMPLHLASFNRHVEAIKVLLDAGATVNVTTRRGRMLQVASPSSKPLFEEATLDKASNDIRLTVDWLRKARDEADSVENLVIAPLIEQAKDLQRKVEALVAARRSCR